MTRPALVRAVACGAFVVAVAAPAHANPESEALRARAANQIYNLDRERGDCRCSGRRSPPILRTPAPIAGSPAGLWLSITFRRGNMTVDDYLGRVNRSGAQPHRQRRPRTSRRRISRRDRPRDRPRAQARRAEPEGCGRPLPAGCRRRACGPPTQPPSRAASAARFAPRAKRTTSTNRCWLSIRSAKMPA